MKTLISSTLKEGSIKEAFKKSIWRWTNKEIAKRYKPIWVHHMKKCNFKGKYTHTNTNPAKMVAEGIHCLQPRVDGGEQSIGSNFNSSEFIYFS